MAQRKAKLYCFHQGILPMLRTPSLVEASVAGRRWTNTVYALNPLRRGVPAKPAALFAKNRDFHDVIHVIAIFLL